MKINKLIVAATLLSVAVPVLAAPSKNPHTQKKSRKPAVVKPAETAAPVQVVSKSNEPDPTKSWQAYSYP